MSAPRALILRSAGTNCDRETALALEAAGAHADRLHLNAVARKPALLGDYDLLVIAGGFSYGDDIAAGRVFARELQHRLGPALTDHLVGGGLTLGICNGFQILVELGLFQPEVDAASSSRRTITLTDNQSGRFEARWVTLRSHACAVPWIVPDETIDVPVAHAEGRFCTRAPSVLDELRARGQVVFTYAPRGGQGTGEVGYPANPNGSEGHVAGLCDPSGSVLGLMPHPERNRTPWNHPLWTRDPSAAQAREGGGMTFFHRMVRHLRATSPAERARSAPPANLTLH